MKLRSLFITVIALFAMVLGGVAAQDMPMMDTCLNLSPDDCAVINEASANGIGDASSFTLELSIDFEAAGVPDMGTLDFAMSGAIDLVQNMDAMLPLSAGGAFEASSMMLPETMVLEFALVDDVLYFSDPTTGEWAGIDVIALMESPEVGEMMNGLMSGDTSALGLGELPDMETLMPLLAILEVPGLMDYTRDGDDFIFTIDLSVLADPENADLLAEIDAVLAEADPEMDGMASALSLFLNEGIIEVVQTVNTDLNIVENIEFSVYAEISEMITGGEEPFTIDLVVNLALTNLDNAPEPEAPAEYTDMTDQVGGMAASMGG